jgi:hypothetical protein
VCLAGVVVWLQPLVPVSARIVSYFLSFGVQPVVGWLRGQCHPQLTRVQTSGLTLWCLIKSGIFFSGRRCFRRQRDVCGDFVNLKTRRMKFLGRSLSKVLIRVGCACVYRVECMCVFVNVYICSVFHKKKNTGCFSQSNGLNYWSRLFCVIFWWLAVRRCRSIKLLVLNSNGIQSVLNAVYKCSRFFFHWGSPRWNL